MTAHRITRNPRPMDYTTRIEPMSAEDEAFWQSRRANDNTRPTWADMARDYAGWLAVALIVALPVVGWVVRGSMHP